MSDLDQLKAEHHPEKIKVRLASQAQHGYYGDSRMESINHEKRTMFSMVWCIILYPILLSP